MIFSELPSISFCQYYTMMRCSIGKLILVVFSLAPSILKDNLKNVLLYCKITCKFVQLPYIESIYNFIFVVNFPQRLINSQCDLSYKTFYNCNCCCIIISQTVCHFPSLPPQSKAGSYQRQPLRGLHSNGSLPPCLQILDQGGNE